MAIAVQATESKKPVHRAIPDRAKSLEAPSRNDFEDALDQAARKEEPAPVEKPKPAKKAAKAEKSDDAPANDDDATAVDETDAVDQLDGEVADEPVELTVAQDELPTQDDNAPKAAAAVLNPAQLLDLPVSPLVAPVINTAPQSAPDDSPSEEPDFNEDEPSTALAPAIVKSAATESAISIAHPHGPTASAAGDTPQSDPAPAPNAAPPKPTVTPITDSALAVPQANFETSEKPAAQSAPVDAATKSFEAIPSPDTSAPLTPIHSTDKLSPDLTAAIASDAPQPQSAATSTSKPVPLPDIAPPELRFAQENHDRIVTSVRTQLLPGGGSMQIRLDPPELGALKVMVEMRDGVMTATFQTSSDEATRLLSHSLNQLKHVLEGQGVSIERLQVQQAPKGEQSRAGDEQNQQQQGWSDEHAARQEQQRKELLRRAWRKASGLGDPIDFMA